MFVMCVGILGIGSATNVQAGPSPTATSTMRRPEALTGPGGITLRSDGLGVVDFGRSDAMVAERLSRVLGPPTEEFLQGWHPQQLAEFGPPDPGDEFTLVPLDRANESTVGLTSRYPYSRALAWENWGLLVYFGGPDLDALRFTGWWVGSGGFTTSYGLGVGNTIADYPGLMPSLLYGDGTCSEGAVRAGGITVFVHSSVGSFEIEGDSPGAPSAPRPIGPGDLEVTGLRAGYLGLSDGLCNVYFDTESQLPATR
jgi:hypothetical protein